MTDVLSVAINRVFHYGTLYGLLSQLSDTEFNRYNVVNDCLGHLLVSESCD